MDILAGIVSHPGFRCRWWFCALIECRNCAKSIQLSRPLDASGSGVVGCFNTEELKLSASTQSCGLLGRSALSRAGISVEFATATSRTSQTTHTSVRSGPCTFGSSTGSVTGRSSKSRDSPVALGCGNDRRLLSRIPQVLRA